tara:strand:- start:69 stop:596 length:528 start_codon:yes stop_codon:yes gene_type:complete
MTTANINDFKANIAGGGARANQFRVFLNTPSIATGLQPAGDSFLIKASSLPGQTITEIAIPFRGRNLYIAGDREFETWTTTVINETDFRIRNGIEKWMSGINDLETSTGVTDPALYYSQLRVEQLDRDNNLLKSYEMKNCWPTAISAIELSYDTVSEVETFDVTWRYTHFSASSV